MSSPVDSRPIDKRYLGNKDPYHWELHDLQNEKPQCQIDEVIGAKNAVVFSPDTLEQAHREGYDNCAYCMGSSER